MFAKGLASLVDIATLPALLNVPVVLSITCGLIDARFDKPLRILLASQLPRRLARSFPVKRE